MSDITILGIESSCDDTAAAIVCNGEVLSNIIAGQAIHQIYGGVVPELASRAHQLNIVPTVHAALLKANVNKNNLQAIAYTRGPGLLGSLLVGSSFAKALSLALHIPLIEVNHMHGHILAHFAQQAGIEKPIPSFPFICLTVSGGHTQIVLVKSYFNMEIIGETLDDAAGEAFDKAAKMLELPYPGGPLIDKHAKAGDKFRFKFPAPEVGNLNFSFSGLKTSFQNFLQKHKQNDNSFVAAHLPDICASIQHTIVHILLKKLKQAAASFNINEIAIAGGVSANSYLRSELQALAEKEQWNLYIPDFEYCTDNAAMIAIAGYFKYKENLFTVHSVGTEARLAF